MFRLALVVSLLLPLAHASTSTGLLRDDPITGMWNGKMGPEDKPDLMAIMMHLTFDGKSAVTGTVEGPPQMGTIQNGTFDPTTGALRLEVVVPGEDTPGVFVGTVKDGVAKGKVTIGSNLGQFELKKTQ